MHRRQDTGLLRLIINVNTLIGSKGTSGLLSSIFAELDNVSRAATKLLKKNRILFEVQSTLVISDG